jgi:hypothetical protein
MAKSSTRCDHDRRAVLLPQQARKRRSTYPLPMRSARARRRGRKAVLDAGRASCVVALWDRAQPAWRHGHFPLHRRGGLDTAAAGARRWLRGGERRRRARRARRGRDLGSPRCSRLPRYVRANGTRRWSPRRASRPRRDSPSPGCASCCFRFSRRATACPDRSAAPSGVERANQWNFHGGEGTSMDGSVGQIDRRSRLPVWHQHVVQIWLRSSPQLTTHNAEKPHNHAVSR